MALRSTRRRIGGAGLLREDRGGRRAGVPEIVQGARVLSDHRVEIAVAVDVGEVGALRSPTSTPLKGSAAPVCSVKVGAAAVPVFLK